MLNATDMKLTSGLNKTVVTVHNPSGDAKLTVFMQGQLPQQVKRFYDYTDDTNVGSIRANGLGSIGGGQFTDDRRFVLVASQPAVIEVVARDSNFVAEALELVNYADAGPCWDVDADRTLDPVKTGAKYALDKDTRVSFKIDPKSGLDGSFINFRQLGGEAELRIIQQTEREMWRRTRVAAWTTPVEVGEIAPGTSRDFVVNDTSRLLVSTQAEKETALEFANTNASRTLRLFTVDADGKETVVANVGQEVGASATGAGAIWANQRNFVSGRVVIRKGLSAVIAQQPQ